MGNKIPSDDVCAVLSLFKAGYRLQSIANDTGVALRTVYRWVKLYRDGIYRLPTKTKTKKPRAASILNTKRKNSGPSLTAKKIKKKNRALATAGSLKGGQRRLHDYLGYRSSSPAAAGKAENFLLLLVFLFILGEERKRDTREGGLLMNFLRIFFYF